MFAPSGPSFAKSTLVGLVMLGLKKSMSAPSKMIRVIMKLVLTGVDDCCAIIFVLY
jgi:hypothetical protein